MILRRCLHCSTQRLSWQICKYCDNTHYIYFSCHLHLCLHHLKHKLPFAISSLLCKSQTHWNATGSLFQPDGTVGVKSLT